MQRGGVKKDDEKREKRLDFMSQEEISMVDDYLQKIENNRSFMDSEYYTEWDEIETVYANNQEILDNHPNSRVNIVNANVEGQVASLVEQNIQVRCEGEGPSDQSFARWGEIGLDWTFRKNHIKRLLDRHERRRELFGPAWFKIYWDPDAIGGFGLVKYTCPPLNAIFVDMKINDPLQIQDAEYIAEVMLKSKSWAVEEYGDIAHNIFYGGTDKSPIFSKEKTTDDEDAFWLIQLWTKTDGKLRLIEFSDDGVLLFDSFKEWDEKKKRFVEKENPEPFYRYNKYPYFLTTMYYEEGKLYGFGDGKLLRPLQDMINDLYDQIRRAARPNRIFFDPDSNVDLEDLDNDDGPVPCDDPNQNIKIVEVGKVNEALWRLLANIHLEVQRVIRFSELMIGQKASTDTATEAAIQQQQGSQGIDHKKLMLQETLIEMCNYTLDLMMEKYEGGRAFKVAEDKDEYEWIDFRQLNEVPVLIPASEGYIKQFKEQNPEAETPQWMNLVNEETNKPETKQVELDIKVSIGAGLPKNKAFLYQMLEKLSQMVVDDRNVLTWQEVRSFVEDFLGLPLADEEELAQQQAQMEQMQQQQEAMQGAEVQNLSPEGNPMMSALPGGGAGAY